MITSGKRVSIEYRLSLPDGTQIENNGNDQLTFVQGSHHILPALETALEGARVGETRHVVLKPSDAYGPIDDENFQSVDLGLIPEDLRYKGALLTVEDDAGEFYKARVWRICQDSAVIDFNHPLAGKTLIFDIWVTEVNENPYIN